MGTYLFKFLMRLKTNPSFTLVLALILMIVGMLWFFLLNCIFILFFFASVLVYNLSLFPSLFYVLYLLINIQDF